MQRQNTRHVGKRLWQYGAFMPQGAYRSGRNCYGRRNTRMRGRNGRSSRRRRSNGCSRSLRSALYYPRRSQNLQNDNARFARNTKRTQTETKRRTYRKSTLYARRSIFERLFVRERQKCRKPIAAIIEAIVAEIANGICKQVGKRYGMLFLFALFCIICRGQSFTVCFAKIKRP